ncbi:ChaN family lipoprotein [Mucilaginibacter sp. AW1-3]
MKSIICFAFLILPFAAFSQTDMQKHFRVYSNVQGKEVSLDDIANDAAKADVLFFGEEHTDSIAHYVEFTILKKLLLKYPGKVALSMEMFETDTQPVLNEYLRGLIRERNFLIDCRAWSNYRDYRPMVEMAKANNMDIIAANAPARYINMVSRLGLSSLNKLDAVGQSHLPPLPIDTASGKYYDKFLKIMGGHTNAGGMQVYQSQNLWDATMGWSIAQYLESHKGAKVFNVNGGFHSEEKLGAVAQFQKYDSKAAVLTIASASGNDLGKPDFAFYSKLADYVILTDAGLAGNEKRP